MSGCRTASTGILATNQDPPDGDGCHIPRDGGQGLSPTFLTPIPALDAYRYGYMIAVMARAATTSDVFNAIAEPQRREILVLLRAGERPVNELARELGMTQPGASKHLRVLR